ncbi:MAG: thymidylate synthase, partial [Proteobacteria bacterium]
MHQYLQLLKRVLETGDQRMDRTGVGTIALFGEKLSIELDRFPLLTTKKVHFHSVAHELLWFLKGETNIAYLKENKVSIWNEWADSNGDLGRIYPAQWRHWKRPDGTEVDQIANVMESLRTNPASRRHMVVAYNPGEIEQMALPPCHSMFQFFVSSSGLLSCQIYQRSVDVLLGMPFNISSYALLTIMMAHCLGLKPGTLHMAFGDTHLYLNHLEQAKTQLLREPKELPTLRIARPCVDLFDLEFEDLILENYEHHPAIKAPIAV